MSEDLDTTKSISYGFRTKHSIPLSGGEIREIIERGGALVFKYLSESNFDELANLLKYKPDLNAALEKWVKWAESEDGLLINTGGK